MDFLVGAASSAAAAYVGPLAGQLVAESTIRTVVSGAAGSAARNTTQALVRPVLTGQRVSAGDIAMSIILGGVQDAALSYVNVQRERLTPQALAALCQLVGRESVAPGGAASVELTAVQRAGSLALDNTEDASLDPAVGVRASSQQPSMAGITEACNSAVGTKWVDRGGPGGTSAPLLIVHDEL